MKLEDEIKQSKFKNAYHKLGVNIVYTANWLSHHHNRQCKEFDITPEQFNILRILRGQHPKPATVNLMMERMLNNNGFQVIDKFTVGSRSKFPKPALDIYYPAKVLVHFLRKFLEALTPGSKGMSYGMVAIKD